MRDRERRLGRSLRGIVLSLLATPLSGAAACHSDADGVDDASVRDSSLPFDDDAGNTSPVDSSVAPPSPDATAVDSAPPAPTVDAAACAPITITDASYDDAPDGCSVFHYLPCGLPDSATIQACAIDLTTCYAIFGNVPAYLSCSLVYCSEAGIDPDAAMIADCTACNGITGRRPRGLCAPRTPRKRSGGSRATKTGEYFATMAHLESASVRAFRDLEKWLAGFGAPLRLTRGTRRAAEDERRHARAAARMARRFGGEPPRPRVESVAAPSLRALIEDDAVEGCVGEMFGALLATFQAEHADDPRIRRTLRRIALDETRHAALSWEILAWGITRLSPADLAQVRAALDGAAAALLRRPASKVDPTTQRLAGHPTAREQRLLAQRLVELVHVEAARAS